MADLSRADPDGQPPGPDGDRMRGFRDCTRHRTAGGGTIARLIPDNPFAAAWFAAPAGGTAALTAIAAKITGRTCGPRGRERRTSSGAERGRSDACTDARFAVSTRIVSSGTLAQRAVRQSGRRRRALIGGAPPYIRPVRPPLRPSTSLVEMCSWALESKPGSLPCLRRDTPSGLADRHGIPQGERRLSVAPPFCRSAHGTDGTRCAGQGRAHGHQGVWAGRSMSPRP
jgi:hypothetical protein